MRNRFFPLRGAHPRVRAGGARTMAAALLLLMGLTRGGAPSPTVAAIPAPEAYHGLYGDSAIGMLDTASEYAATSTTPSPQMMAQAPQAAAATVGTGAQIHIKNFAFGPATITLEAGQTLTWINDDPVPHTTTAQDKQWNSGQVAPGKSFTVTVTKPGTYVYNCLIHPFMQAKVVVAK